MREMNSTRLRIVAFVLALGCVAGGFAAYRNLDDDVVAVRTRTVTASIATVSETVTASGAVDTPSRAVSFGTSGEVTEILVAVGDRVEAGQPLAVVDASTQQIQLQQAKASLATAKARLEQLTAGLTAPERRQLEISMSQSELQLRNARRAVEDAKVGVAQNAKGYELQLTQARNSLATARKNVELNARTAQASVDQAQANLDNARKNTQFSATGASSSLTQAQIAAENARRNAQLSLASLQLSLDQASQSLANEQATLGQLSTDHAAAQSDYNVKAGAEVSAKATLDAATGADVNPATAAYNAARTAAIQAKASLDAANAKLQAQQPRVQQAQNQLAAATNAYNSGVERDRQSTVNAELGAGSAANNAASTNEKDQQAVRQAEQALQNALTSQAASATKDQQSIVAAQTAFDSARNNQVLSAEKDAQSVRSAEQALANALTNQQSSASKDEQSIAAAEASLASVRNSVAASKLKDEQSVTNARSQLNSAAASMDNTKAGNEVRLAPPKQADLSAAVAAVQQADASVLTAQKAVDDATLKAPAPGVITAVNIRVGDSSSGSSGASGTSGAGGAGGAAGASGTGSGAMQLTDLDNLTVSAGFSESNAAKLLAGQAAIISFDAITGVRLDATVKLVSETSTLSNGVVTYNATFALPADAAAQGVKPGMTAQVEVTTASHEDVVTLPSSAIRTAGGQRIVMVVDAKTNAQTPARVQIGLRGDTLTEIVSGLEAGAVVALPNVTATSGGAPGGGLGGRGLGGAGGGLGGGLGGGGLGGGGGGGGPRG